MTQSEIEQTTEKAEIYIKNQSFSHLSEDDKLFEAFFAGAESRQTEIDELRDRISSLEANIDVEVNQIQTLNCETGAKDWKKKLKN